MIYLPNRILYRLKVDEQQFKAMMYANERTVYSERILPEVRHNYYLAVYYGEDDMNIFVFGIWEQADDNTVSLDNPILSIIDGVYNFYDYDMHKALALHQGITTGYRRRPKENAVTKYKPNETYEYNGRPITPDIKKRLAEKFGMFDYFKHRNSSVHECNKCHKKNKEL